MTKTKQLQFLQSPDYHNVGDPNQADISLSDYNFGKVRKLKNVSPLRWVRGVALHLSPGKGSGRVIIGKHTFNVVYAWGGRDKPEGGRSSYTVRIEGENVKAILVEIAKQITIDELGSLSYEVPFREYQKAIGNKSVISMRRSLVECLEYFKKNPSPNRVLPDVDVEAAVAKFKKDWKENKPVTLYHVCPKIETDILR